MIARLKAMAALSAAGAALFAAAPLKADEAAVEKFYSGKTIIMSVGSGVGSGGDTYARLIAQFIGKHIPGKPTVVVENMPAAGGLVHMNQMYKQAKRDGTAIELTRESMPFEPLLLGSASKAAFDVAKINWLSSPNSFPNVAVAWHTAKVKTAADLRKEQLIVGGIGQTGSTNDAYVLNNLLGFKFKVINGYPGPAEIDLAMETGELEGRATAGWTGLTTRHPDWLAEKKVNILYQTGFVKYPSIPDSVPSLLDLAETEEQRAILKLKYASNAVGFPFFAPPEVPKDRVEALRKAFVDTYADTEFKAAAAAQKVDVFPVGPEDMAKIYADAYAAPPEMIAKLAELSKPSKN
jgi:tripartite-type tricarboxylate transporter receptor subunit TctC